MYINYTEPLLFLQSRNDDLKHIVCTKWKSWFEETFFWYITFGNRCKEEWPGERAGEDSAGLCARRSCCCCCCWSWMSCWKTSWGEESWRMGKDSISTEVVNTALTLFCHTRVRPVSPLRVTSGRCLDIDSGLLRLEEHNFKSGDITI